MWVGWLLSLPFTPWLLTEGNIDSDAARRWLTGALTFLLGLGYYALVRWLEGRWPRLGLLLGVPVRPSYEPVSVGKHADLPPTIATATVKVTPVLDWGPLQAQAVALSSSTPVQTPVPASWWAPPSTPVDNPVDDWWSQPDPDPSPPLADAA